MISRQEASELIFAGVLGCLDLSDQTKLNEYIKSRGELPPNVGEFQNIAAMLPVILTPESPDPQLKDKVARKLYRIKDEVRSRSTGESVSAEDFYKNSRRDRQSLLSGSSIEPEKSAPEEKRNEPEVKEIVKPPLPDSKDEKLITETKEPVIPEEFETVTPLRSTFESFKSTREKVLEGNFSEEGEEKKSPEIKTEPKIPAGEKIKTSERIITKDKIPHKTAAKELSYYKKATTKERGKILEKAYRKKPSTIETPVGNKPLYLWIAVSVFVILFLAVAVIYLNFSSEIKNLQLNNESLRQRLNDLSVKFSNTQEIQDFIESPDAKIINLKGTGINPEGKGKLIISLSQNKGYLQLSDMPVLGNDKSYQLWVQLPSGGYYSLGVYNPAGRIQYFPFNIPQSVIENINEFIVTEESSGGAARPGNKEFLSGSF
ncbi:MAG TPA: anti-sigma factor [Ignavibacteriaceae bacterium]|nr:anti-sigma factor [Ignavibacteriaceae bacterium]